MKNIYEEWIRLKALEKATAKQRINIEADIYRAHMDEVKDEGSLTINAGGFKTRINTGYTRTWDFAQIKDHALFGDAFEASYKENRKKFKSLHPDVQKVFNKALTEKPKKPNFVVERIEND